MSDIRGEGHGSAHDWRHDLTDKFAGGQSGTRYLCRHGDAVFVHLYDQVPDIFEAMKAGGVPAGCVGAKPEPVAAEYTPTSLAAAEHALATLRCLRHMPAPSSISIQSFPEQPGAHVYMLLHTADDVRAWASALETEAGEYDAGDGVVHTSTEATVLGVPVRVTHVSDPDPGQVAYAEARAISGQQP